MPSRLLAPAALLAALALAGCSAIPFASPAPPTTLRAAAERQDRLIGTAVDRSFRLGGGPDTLFRRVLAREFNLITAENDMKFSRLRPSRDRWSFDRADSLVAFAERNGMKVRGHTLVWHRQVSPWVTNGAWTRDEARALMEEHIDRVAGRYRGKLIAWDVVNEAVADDASMRKTFWLENVGPEYIEIAFRRAHAADPEVPLFYNDYGAEGMNAKSDSVYALVKRLKERGVPIHGVGLQMHFTVGRMPRREAIAANMARLAALGLKIHVTELDVRMRLPSTEEQLQQQAQAYRDAVGVCVENPACEVVVLWGFTDRDSWIPGSYPGFGDSLPFDSAYAPKPAYHALRDVLAGR